MDYDGTLHVPTAPARVSFAIICLRIHRFDTIAHAHITPPPPKTVTTFFPHLI